jgi:hypothetical protein
VTWPRRKVFRSADKPNDLTILAEYEDAARACRIFQSADFRQATRGDGVTPPPEVTMANQLHQVPA